jgi:hypothetical protein
MLFSMLTAVNLDDDIFFETDKVNDINTDRLLTAEFDSGYLFIPESGPKISFGIRLTTT